jgi:hypothetical protein
MSRGFQMPGLVSALRTTATPAQARGGLPRVVLLAGRWKSKARDRAFRKAVEVHIADLPDWYRILHPPRSAGRSPAAGVTSKPSAHAT